MASSSEKRCHYEILGLSRDCSPEEIRSAYKKLALQRHPDKLIKTGIPEEEATAAFQELVSAYEVLSDPRERTWYDSHRSQILFSDSKSSKKSSGPVPDLFSFFSNSVFSGFGDTRKGFYKVYGDIFGKIYDQELSFARKLGLGQDSVNVAPLIGNLESDYAQVTAFYGYWLGFVTVMDFCWVDEYDAMEGPNRKSRRLMEEENKKARKKARREYNDTVRGLAEFAKKRDKRVVDMQMKRQLEQEKKREEEKKKKKEEARIKLERARLYEEPEWAKVDEEEEIEDVVEEEEKGNKRNELYCVVCSKKFKSDKQWKNHEQSKKHREKVAELREAYEEEQEEEEEEDEVDGDVNDIDDDFGPSTSVDNGVDELCEQFEDGIGFQEEKSGFRNSSMDEERSEASNNDNGDGNSEAFEANEETNNTKEMASKRKSKKKSTKRQTDSYPSDPHIGSESEDIDLMVNNSRRNARKNRASKREGAQKCKDEAVRAEEGEDTEEVISKSDGTSAGGLEDSSDAQDTSSHMPEEVDLDNRRDPLLDKNQKVPTQRLKKKSTGNGDTNAKAKDAGKADTNAKSRNTSKGKKQKNEYSSTVSTTKTKKEWTMVIQTGKIAGSMEEKSREELDDRLWVLGWAFILVVSFCWMSFSYL